jgi:hypothetical protein
MYSLSFRKLFLWQPSDSEPPCNILVFHLYGSWIQSDYKWHLHFKKCILKKKYTIVTDLHSEMHACPPPHIDVSRAWAVATGQHTQAKVSLPQPQVMSSSSCAPKILVVCGWQGQNQASTRRFQGPTGQPRTYYVPIKGKQSWGQNIFTVEWARVKSWIIEQWQNLCVITSEYRTTVLWRVTWVIEKHGAQWNRSCNFLHICGKEVLPRWKTVQVLTQAIILFKYGCLVLFARSLFSVVLKHLM